MKYLKNFNRQLKMLRDSKKLSCQEISSFCMVDTSVVAAWETDIEANRCYPTLDNVLDLCFKTGVTLDYFIQFPDQDGAKQLALPGLAFSEDADLSESLRQLDDEIERLIPSEDEQELLKRYRKSDKQSRELILQLIAN